MSTPYFSDGVVLLYRGDCVELLGRDELGYDWSSAMQQNAYFLTCLLMR